MHACDGYKVPYFPMKDSPLQNGDVAHKPQRRGDGFPMLCSFAESEYGDAESDAGNS